MNDIQHMDPAIRKLMDLRDMLNDQTNLCKIKEEIDSIIQLTKRRDEYCLQTTSLPSDPLNGISEMTSSHPWNIVHDEGKTSFEYAYDPIIMSGHLEGEFLKSFVSVSQAKNVLEIGMFTGYSALAMAEALPENGSLVTLEMEPYLLEIAQKNFELSKHGYKIQILLGKALDSLRKLSEEGRSFDIIFMDADKKEYETYYQIIMESKLLGPGGTIIVDNALYRGGTYTDINDERGCILRKFNQMLSEDQRVHKVMLPVRDGILLIRRITDVIGAVKSD